jgi:hypothetical protein
MSGHNVTHEGLVLLNIEGVLSELQPGPKYKDDGPIPRVDLLKSNDPRSSGDGARFEVKLDGWKFEPEAVRDLLEWIAAEARARALHYLARDRQEREEEQRQQAQQEALDERMTAAFRSFGTGDATAVRSDNGVTTSA